VQAKAGRLAVDFHRRSVGRSCSGDGQSRIAGLLAIDWGGASKVMYSDATVELTLCLRLVAGTTGERKRKRKKKEKRRRIIIYG
jgi:hypothetical protein